MKTIKGSGIIDDAEIERNTFVKSQIMLIVYKD